MSFPGAEAVAVAPAIGLAARNCKELCCMATPVVFQEGGVNKMARAAFHNHREMRNRPTVASLRNWEKRGS
jgi:hypothetical protein